MAPALKDELLGGSAGADWAQEVLKDAPAMTMAIIHDLFMLISELVTCLKSDSLCSRTDHALRRKGSVIFG